MKQRLSSFVIADFLNFNNVERNKNKGCICYVFLESPLQTVS